MPTFAAPGASEVLDPSLRSKLTALGQMEPEAALRESANLMAATLGRRGLPETLRLSSLFALDQAVQRQARACIEEYVAAAAVGSATRHSLWRIAHEHWSLVFDAYGACLAMAEGSVEPVDDKLLVELSVRAIRAGAQCVKWDAFRHGPMTEAVWARINRAYRLCAERELTRRNLRLRADRATETTVEREYLRVLALHSLGVDQLDAYRLELASRLIQYVLPWLELTEVPDAASLHWVDVAGGNAPARLTRTPDNVGLPRFFSGIVAAQPLQDMLELVVAGEIPAPLLNLSDPIGQEDQAPARLASVLSHMIRCWSNEPPVRRHRRHAMPGTLLVVNGLVQFARRLAGDSGVGTRVWQMQDASLQGVGAEAPLDEADDLAVGVLIGMHLPDGDRWRVGAVRRLWRSGSGIGKVGIELMGGTPAAAEVDDGAGQLNVIVLDTPRRGHPVRVLVPVPGPRPGAAIYLLGGAAPVKLSPLTTLEYGSDHEIRMYLFGA